MRNDDLRSVAHPGHLRDRYYFDHDLSLDYGGMITITEAAIRQDGKVITGKRHDLVIKEMILKYGFDKIVGEQGFVTSDGRFVDREEAANIAFVAGQIPEKKDCLFSEDIW